GAVFDAVLHGTQALPARVNPQTPGELESVIQKALEKDCEVRYQHASEMRADLSRARRDTSSASSARVPIPTPRARTSPKPWILVVGTVVVLALAGSLIWRFRQPSPHPESKQASTAPV